MAVIQTVGSFNASHLGINMNSYPLAEPGSRATRAASTTKIRKKSGIMILLLFSILLAPSNKVSRVPMMIIIWNGTTEKSVIENDSNHSEVLTCIKSPDAESTNAFNT